MNRAEYYNEPYDESEAYRKLLHIFAVDFGFNQPLECHSAVKCNEIFLFCK